jgi:hypothetical protein
LRMCNIIDAFKKTTRDYNEYVGEKHALNDN